jgi:alpha-L-rhamnosidase
MKKLILAVIFFGGLTGINGQDVYESYRAGWLKKSRQYLPELQVKVKEPMQTARLVKDIAAYQYVRALKADDSRFFYQHPLKSIPDDLVLDFGDHVTGQVQFIIESNIAAHAPVQLKIKFAEVPAEMAARFESYEGSLSKAWLQEEIVTLHTMPDTVLLPHRYAFRYVNFEILASATDMEFYVRDVRCFSSTSAGKDLFSGTMLNDPEFQAISEISIKTLEECMQTVFEDGPKRDRRIWVGDLKLQALANYYSFGNFDLVKRGLYLYAATAAENGLVYGTLFEKPEPHPQKHFPIDYSLLYNSVLTDYYEASKDIHTLEDLWIVAKYQVLNVLPHISDKGIFTASPDWWYFIDWNNELDKQVALQGIAIYSLAKTWDLAKIVGEQNELPHLPETIKLMKKAARETFFDAEEKLFISGPSRQVSAASQIWMILSGTVSPEEGKMLFENIKKKKEVVWPVSPYLYHYITEAMITCGMYEEAGNLIKDYWGGMVKKGADTFWEVYDPNNDFLSPYGSFMMNSYCHAWSCTPVYFLRKYRSELNTDR